MRKIKISIFKTAMGFINLFNNRENIENKWIPFTIIAKGIPKEPKPILAKYSLPNKITSPEIIEGILCIAITIANANRSKNVFFIIIVSQNI